MKINRSQLKQIIKEELEATIDEGGFTSMDPAMAANDLQAVYFALHQLKDPQVLAAAIGGGAAGAATGAAVMQVASLARKLSSAMKNLDLDAGLERSDPGMMPDGRMAEDKQ